MKEFLADPLTYVIFVAILGVTALVKHRIRSEVNNRFAKQLEEHKHDLGLATEAAKYDFQRRLAEFGHYAARKHEAAAKVWESLRVAHGAVVGLRGLEYVSTMGEYNEEDLLSVFESLRMPKGKQHEVIEHWRSDQTAALAAVQPYLRMLRIQQADRLLTDARNTLYLNELYLPEAVISVVEPLVAELGEWMAFSMDPPGPSELRWRPNRKRMKELLEAAHVGLRAFVSGAP